MTHLAVQRCLYSYFTGTDAEAIPKALTCRCRRAPLLELTPTPHGTQVRTHILLPDDEEVSDSAACRTFRGRVPVAFPNTRVARRRSRLTGARALMSHVQAAPPRLEKIRHILALVSGRLVATWDAYYDTELVVMIGRLRVETESAAQRVALVEPRKSDS